MAHKKDPPPSCARAVARIKFGRYKGAEQEVLRELEKREVDLRETERGGPESETCSERALSPEGTTGNSPAFQRRGPTAVKG